jgi:hypothetical protein
MTGDEVVSLQTTLGRNMAAGQSIRYCLDFTGEQTLSEARQQLGIGRDPDPPLGILLGRADGLELLLKATS